jgi:hypothetical protein
MSGDEVAAPVRARPDEPSAIAEEPMAIHGPGTAVAATAAAETEDATEAEALNEAAIDADTLRD